MQYCISDGILKHNGTKTLISIGSKAVGTGIHNPCNWQIFPCELVNQKTVKHSLKNLLI